MSKRLIALFLCLCMMMSFLVVPVSAQETETVEANVLAGNCPCGCGNDLADVQWRAWDPNTTGVVSSGHYYLEGDYTQNAQMEIISGNKVVLDLRGHSLTTDDYHRLFLLRGYLAVMDSVGGGRFSAKTTGGGYGGIVMVSNNETNDATLEIFGGTMMPDATNKGSRRGGMVYLTENTTFRMYGGRLMNGTTVNGTYNEPGGAVAGYSSSARIEILGGEIIGCESSNYGGSIYNTGTTILKNCRIIGGIAAKSGGNICQDGGSLTMENCIVADGISNGSGDYGGNITFLSSAVFSMKNCTVRNGYAVGNGGNIYIGTASGTIESTQICAGVAGACGNNIYASKNCTGMVIRDCVLPGDCTFLGNKITLEGKVQIGLLNNGLQLRHGDSKSVVDAKGLAEGSEIYVDADGVFTDGSANADYFKGAIRTVISQSADGLVAAQAEDGQLGGYCPHCSEQVAWHAFSATGSLVENCLHDSAADTDPNCTGNHLQSGHYYLAGNQSSMPQYFIGAYIKAAGGSLATRDVVVDLSGYSISAIFRAFYIYLGDGTNKSNLTLLDSVGNGVVSGGGVNNQTGGVVYNEGCVLNIYGGKYVYRSVTGRNITGGGVIFNSGTFNMYGGTLDASAFSFTDYSTSEKTYTYNGGVLHSTNGAKRVTITAGGFIGGSVQSGGCAHFGYNNIVNITGGQFIGGRASTQGGAIRLYSTSVNGSYPSNGVFNMSGAAVRDGYADTSGGNLYTHCYTVNVTDCYLDGGTVGDNGGNITVGAYANTQFSDCVIVNGNANRSGNIHVASTYSTITMENSLLANGTSKTYAGNINANHGYVTIKGGQILFGTAATYGGNIATNAGNYAKTSDNYTRISADSDGNASLIAGGKAGTDGGNIYLSGVLYLDDAQLVNGTATTAGNDIYMAQLAQQSLLSIGKGVTGEMSVFIHSSFFDDGGYGAFISNTACEKLSARIRLEGDYDGALLCAADGKLSIGAIAVVDGNGTYTWHADIATAIEQCPADGFVRLYTAQDVVLTRNCAVDICGQTVNVSGAYTLYGMDSSGDDFSVPTGKVIVAAETTVASSTDVAGKQYISVAENDGVSFHRIQAQITEVALRPSADGLYYTGSFGCDEIVGANIESYGVAVSTVNMPTKDFVTDEDTLYTEFAGNTMENGSKKTGVLISGIMKDDRSSDLNSAYGQMPVFAAAYLKLKDGSVVLSDTDSQNDDVAYSLYGVLSTLDELIMEDPINYRPMTNALRSFHTKWKDAGMGNWELNKIPKPDDDGVIDVLLIGNSFCYYFVEELYHIAKAAGVPMRVCNLYYSGASPKDHWTWWKNGESICQFFNTDGNGRVVTDNVGLEWALAQAEWDVLSLQYPSGAVSTTSPQQSFSDSKLYTDELSAYLREQFPDAMLCWQQIWAYQVGYNRDGYQVANRDTQVGLYQRHKELAYMAADAYDFTLIPSGEAWELVRQGGYDQLCARLGKGTNNVGDYYHDGDIGGGQYLNACVWFEMITGKSCVGNTYVPTYTYSGTTYGLLSDITVDELQDAAHRAVEELKAQ